MKSLLWLTVGVVVLGCATSEGASDVGPAGGAAGSDAGNTGGTDAGGGSGGTPSGGTGGTSGTDAGGSGGGGTDAGGADGGQTCTAASDCPAPSNECVEATCKAGACSTKNVTGGIATATQTAGDCKKSLCDGNGNIVQANDDTDLPNDSKTCTEDKCYGGVPTHPNVAAGTSCGTGLSCDGSGNCGGCVSATECPGQDTECATRTCVNGVCGTSFAASGKITTAQTAGDCKRNQCDGAGKVAAVADGTDVPVDGKQCTMDLCAAGTPSNPPATSGTICSEGGGNVCNGAGVCVVCLAASDCAPTGTVCATATCTAGTCGISTTPYGTPIASQTAGDCKKAVCDGIGGSTTVPDDTDLPVDGKQCTTDACSSGIPSNPPKPQGSACSESGGKLCNASGTCVECLVGSDCASNICQNGVCTSVSCGSGKIDCNGSSGDGCECSGSSCCGNACMPVHNNGLGQTFEDCAPLGVPGSPSTYSQALAIKARAAWTGTGTDGLGKCQPGGIDVVVRQGTTTCAVWGYEGAIAGYVHVGATCACPSTSDPTWQ